MRHSGVVCLPLADRLTRALRASYTTLASLGGMGDPSGFAAGMGSRAGDPSESHRGPKLAVTEPAYPAMLDLKTLARPFRYRVVHDTEGLPVIPGRLGQIESHDGQALAVLQHTTPDLRLAVGRAGGAALAGRGPGGPGASYRSRPSPRPPP